MTMIYEKIQTHQIRFGQANKKNRSPQIHHMRLVKFFLQTERLGNVVIANSVSAAVSLLNGNFKEEIISTMIL